MHSIMYTSTATCDMPWGTLKYIIYKRKYVQIIVVYP